MYENPVKKILHQTIDQSSLFEKSSLFELTDVVSVKQWSLFWIDQSSLFERKILNL